MESKRNKTFAMIFLDHRTSIGLEVHVGKTIRHPQEGRAHLGGGRAPLPRGFLVASLTYTPSLLDCFHSKNKFREVSGQLDSI